MPYGIEPARRVTILKRSVYFNLMTFKRHPTMVRIDNESNFDIYLSDHEVKPDTINRDDSEHSIRVAALASAIMPFRFEKNVLWGYSPQNDATIKVSYTDSNDIMDMLKLIAGVPGADIVENTVSNDNSTATALKASASFVGKFIDVLNYVQAGVIVRTDIAGTLYLDYSSDGINVDKSFTINVTDTSAGNYVSFTPRARYLRLRYTNGATDQSTFRMQLILSRSAKGFNFLPLGDTSLTDAAITLLTKSVIVGRNFNGTYRNVPVDNGDRLRVNDQPYLYCIAEGDVPDHDPFSKLGFITGLTGASELTVTPQGGDYVFPAAAMQMSMRSSDNSQDKAGGTGALTVEIHYLDVNYAEQTEIITLNGTTWVDTVATNIFRVNFMNVKTAGSGGKPVGNISLVDTATKGITYGYIEATRNRMRQAVYTVPAGKTLFVVQINWGVVTTAANKYGRVTLLANYDDQSETVMAKGLFIALAETTLTQSAQQVPLLLPIKIPATVDIKVNGFTDGNATVNVAIRGWIED
jgi:hypothetical protein